MLALRTKMYVAASTPAALTIATFYLSTTVTGSDAAFLFRLGMTLAIGGVLICVVTLDAHRIGELQQDLARCKARLDAAGHDVATANRRADELEARLGEHLGQVDDDQQCRGLFKKWWTVDDDARLRAFLQRDESSHRDDD